MSRELSRQLGLTDKEYDMILEQLGREPNAVELNMYSVMWSEHCSYKHSRSTLALFPTEGKRVVQGPGENAGVVDIGNGWGVVFKIESHNHPSAIEPYQGAATGVGGILRDIFTMGAQPVAFLNSLRFGPLDNPRNRYLFDGVVAGVGGYGNCVGIPTVGGEVCFEPCYSGNPLVNAMCVGVMPLKNLVLARAGGEGNLLLLAGARTGRDGIHGVTFASEELSQASEERRPAVQVGDPFLGKLLMDATLEVISAGLACGVQDLGGAGLTCALTETAARGGCGLKVDLDKVPLREAEMEPFAILTSESQERMLLIVTPENLHAVSRIYEKSSLPLAVIGRVTAGDCVEVWHHGELLARVPAASVAGGAPALDPPRREPACLADLNSFDTDSLPATGDAGRSLLKLLGSPDGCSREWVWRRYDHSVRTCTVQGPGGDAAVVRLRETGQALALAVDGNGRLTYLNPRLGGALAVAEATRNLSCSGAEPVGITDCLNFGNPEKPEVFWQFRQAVEGMAEACRTLDVPVVGGNVSFYNEVEDEAIYPTPVVGAVGLLPGPGAQCRPAFRGEGEAVFLLGASAVSLGGSLFLKVCHGKVAGSPAPIDLDLEKRLQILVRRLIAGQLVRSAHDLSEGGLAVALAECCLAGSLGATIDLPPGEGLERQLFGEGPSRVLVSCQKGDGDKLGSAAAEAGVPCLFLGSVAGQGLVIRQGGESILDLPLERLARAYGEVFQWIMD